MLNRLAVLLCALVLACATPTSTASSGAAALADSLRAAGLTVESAGTVEQPFFTVPARVYIVGGEDVQIYEFATAAEAERAAATVGATGSTIGTSSMSWMAPPHFFRKDNLIVNYLGSSEATLRELERLLGKQFAGHAR